MHRKVKNNTGRGFFLSLVLLLVFAALGGGLLFLVKDIGIGNIAQTLGIKQVKEIPILGSLASHSSLPTINEETELAAYVNEALEAGEDQVAFRTEDLDDDFIGNINAYIEAFYGTCRNYTTTDLKLFREVTMDCERSNAWYVEKYLLEGEEIPEEKEEAAELAGACTKILDRLDLDDLSEYRKEKKIHDYIIGHCVYTLEGDRNVLSAAEGPILYGEGVCSGYSRAMKLLCDLAGLTCRTIVGTGDGVDHEWNLVRLGGNWYHVDVTWDDPAPDQDYPMFAYLNLDDEAIAIDHQWDEAYYPKAESRTYDYYLLNDAYCEDYDEFKDYMEEACASAPDTVRVMVGDYSAKKYSDSNLEFLFAEGARKYSYSVCGPAGRTEYYFAFSY